MYEDVLRWFESGAPLQEGIRLFSLYNPTNKTFLRLIQSNHTACYPILVKQLARQANIDIEKGYKLPAPVAGSRQHTSEQEHNQNLSKTTLPAPVAVPVSNTTTQRNTTQTTPVTFRTQFPFLAEPTCPPELKILAANKITAYHAYTTGHNKLFDCSTLQECFSSAKAVVENYIDNRAILAEFHYYMEHGSTLGSHPVFKELRDLHKLRKLSVVELIKRQTKIQHNIWRIQSEIAKKNKPHLDVDRSRSIQTKTNELSEITNLINTYQ